MAVVFGFVNNHVARMVGNDVSMDMVAEQLLRTARTRAAAHVDTTAYIRGLRVRNVPGKKGVRDRLVEATDKASLSIEYGHAQRNNRAGRNQANFRWVPGQFILTGAINAVNGPSYTSFGRIKRGSRADRS